MERDPSTLEEAVRPNPLMRYEIACLTAGVPATGDPVLNKIIITGQRARMAAEVMGMLRSLHGPTGNYDSDSIAEEALKLADSLLKKLKG